MIYVQIAAYRDPELVPTLRDLFGKASNPNQLRVCIAYQYDENMSLSEFASDPRVEVIYIPHQETLGCCWARHKINQRYNGEEYTLQLDSHHRFARNWDSTLIDMLSSLPGKPVITTYAPAYKPGAVSRVKNPWCMEIDPKQPKDIPCFRPYYSNHKEPKLTYCLSAHFLFARGQFIVDVPYDPELYFHGEEITMAARAYCAGYDLYHPHKAIVWHEYTREGRAKQWDDDQEWWKKDASSKLKVMKMLSGEILIDGERTLAQYKQLAGI